MARLLKRRLLLLCRWDVIHVCIYTRDSSGHLHEARVTVPCLGHFCPEPLRTAWPVVWSYPLDYHFQLLQPCWDIHANASVPSGRTTLIWSGCHPQSAHGSTSGVSCGL